MITDDQRAALNRLRSLGVGLVPSCSNPVVRDEWKHFIALCQLAIREHPSDEDEPFSQNFLESIGFAFHDDPVDLATLRIPGHLCIVLRRDYSLHLDRIHLPHIKTRGDVRELFRALKIPVLTQPTSGE